MEKSALLYDSIKTILVFIITFVGLIIILIIFNTFINQVLLGSQMVEYVWTLIPAIILIQITLGHGDVDLCSFPDPTRGGGPVNASFPDPTRGGGPVNVSFPDPTRGGGPINTILVFIITFVGLIIILIVFNTFFLRPRTILEF